MIICFSGTGNSRHIANLLSLYTHDTNIVDIDDKLLDSNDEIDVGSAPRILWVFPIYAWGVPSLVLDFIAKAKLIGADNINHFMIATCGDDLGLSHKQWRKAISLRGWTAIATYSILMPNIYTLLPGFDVDPKHIEIVKLHSAKSRVEIISKSIISNKQCDDVITGSWKWLKSQLIRPLFERYLMSPKPFHVVKDRCVSCGKCAKMCPMHNVSLNKDGHPQWNNRCAMCLACYHCCPQHAIEYGNRTKNKGQYFLKGNKTLHQDCTSSS